MIESKKVPAVKWGSNSDVAYVDRNDALECGNGSLPPNSRRSLQSRQVTAVWIFEEPALQ